ncbi:MAG: polysaccharide deacetylase family protein, partial [Pontibacter sp.]|nr:polysaccharide deacetylase family protein [Pontibacter sp.]
MLTTITRSYAIAILAAATFITACNSHLPDDATVGSSTDIPASVEERAALPPADTAKAPVVPVLNPAATATDILAQPEVPILCYHQIRDWTASDSELAKTYIVPEQRFRDQIRMLADSGYHTISPDELMAYLTANAPLPPKPIILTFDDTNLTQYEIAAPELEKYGFKGAFFIMTVSLGRPRYMNKAQVKELAERGHTIGNHTWDHQNVKKYEAGDWPLQVDKPKKTL